MVHNIGLRANAKSFDNTTWRGSRRGNRDPKRDPIAFGNPTPWLPWSRAGTGACPYSAVFLAAVPRDFAVALASDRFPLISWFLTDIVAFVV